MGSSFMTSTNTSKPPASIGLNSMGDATSAMLLVSPLPRLKLAFMMLGESRFTPDTIAP